MGRKPPKFEDLRSEYAGLWSHMEIRSECRHELERNARAILSNRMRYDVVAKATGVPWYVIGIIHTRESTRNFSTHLHNGDSLKARTRQVPAGRPPKGDAPFKWEDSAIDALTMPGKEFHKIQNWSIERIAYSAELFNGFGYRWYHPETHSPYLWSYSTIYDCGKYVSDGKWSAVAKDKQPGCLALMKALMDLDAGVDAMLETGLAPSPKAVSDSAVAATPPPASMLESKSGNTAVVQGVTGGGITTDAVSQSFATAAAAKPDSTAEFARELAFAVLSNPQFWVGLLFVGTAVFLWLDRRYKLIKWGI